MNTSVLDHDLLTADQEIILARQIETGLAAEQLMATDQNPPDSLHQRGFIDERETLINMGRSAFDIFVSANLRLVARCALDLARRTGGNRDDLFQEGIVGLVHAIHRFDHCRGNRFATMAVLWIKSAMLAAIRGQRIPETGLGIHAPRKIQLVCVPTEDLADQAAQSADHDQVLDDMTGLGSVLTALNGLERRVIEYRFGATSAAHTLTQTAQYLSCSVSKVKRIEQGALAKLNQRLVHWMPLAS